MACVINADPILREYIEAHAANNVVTIYSKIGVLRLASELEEEHEAGIELTRVLRSFAGRALSYADTTRANILDGTFEWPEASRQPVINQIKATHKEAIQDFGDFPIVVNDDQHQEDYVKVNPYEPDHSAIDNYDQDARRCNALLKIDFQSTYDRIKAASVTLNATQVNEAAGAVGLCELALDRTASQL